MVGCLPERAQPSVVRPPCLNSARRSRYAKLLPENERELFVRGEAVGEMRHVCGGARHESRTPEQLEWPMHAPIGTLIPWSSIRRAARCPALTARERYAFGFLSDPELFRECARDHPRAKSSVLSVADVKQIIDNAIFETCDDPIGTGYVFDVMEYQKRRRRLVHDALSANVLLPDAPNPKFLTIEEVQRMTLCGSYGATIDMKAFYYQFPLAEAVRKFFPILVDGQWLQPCVLPMGFKWAVVIAQAFMRFVAFTANIPATACDIYIDNFLLVGSKSEVDEMFGRIMRVLNDLGVTAGDVEKGTVVTHRGMSMDFTAKTVALKASFVEKLRTRMAAANQTWGQIRSIIGMVVYALMVLDKPLASIFHVFKFWARHVFTSPRKIVTLWQTSREELNAAINYSTRNTPLKIKTRPRGRMTMVITDASLEGGRPRIAGLLVQNGRVRWFAETVRSTATDIAVFETLAVQKAIVRWSHALQGRSALLLCDNTVTLSALARGMSCNYTVNSMVGVMHEFMLRRDIYLGLMYVPSKANASDPLTREWLWSNEQAVALGTAIHWSTLCAPGGVDDFLRAQERLFGGSHIPVFRYRGDVVAL